MKNKTILKKILILFTLIIIFFMQNNIYAISMDDMINTGDDFISQGEIYKIFTATIYRNKLEEASATIYNIFLSIAIVVATIMAIYLGIKFMMASAVDKAEVKESLLVFVIGCVVAFGAFGIWGTTMRLLY